MLTIVHRFRLLMRKASGAGTGLLLALLASVAVSTRGDAQDARDVFLNTFGAFIQSAIVQATQKEWRRLPPGERSCVDQTLNQRGISLGGLIQRGVTPSDPRISDVLASCQSEQQQTHLSASDQPAPQPAPADVYGSVYVVEGLALGGRVAFDSAVYREYQCRPSDQFAGFTWCHKERKQKASRGTYIASYTILHSDDGTAYYINHEHKPAFFGPGDVNSEIDRLSRKIGGQPNLISLQQRQTSLKGIIASWGKVVLEPLDPSAISELASGRSVRRGILLDFIGNFRESARRGLPIYRATGGAGFVWAASYDSRGRGTLRFFAMDPSVLSSAVAENKPASPPTPSDKHPSPPTSTIDHWQECQSQDADSKLRGCTAIIEAKGPHLAAALDSRCAAYNSIQQYERAREDCQAAIELNPRYSYAYTNLGAAYLGLKHYEKAIEVLGKGVELKTNSTWSRLYRARAFEGLGKKESALKDYQYALD